LLKTYCLWALSICFRTDVFILIDVICIWDFPCLDSSLPSSNC
jgi:hypothetical protein